MATYTVTTISDIIDPNDAVLSLRETLQQANATTAADVIRFSTAVEGQTIVLAGTELIISQDVTIDGDQNDDGTPDVIIDANRASRVLHIDGNSGDEFDPIDVTLDGLVITRGATTTPAAASSSARTSRSA